MTRSISSFALAATLLGPIGCSRTDGTRSPPPGEAAHTVADASATPPASPVAAAPAPGPALAAEGGAVASAPRIRRVDGRTFEIERALIDQMLADPAGWLATVRLVPVVRDARPDGFHIFAIRPGSVPAALGLLNGDTLHAIDGHPVDVADPELAARLGRAHRVTLELTRRGKTFSLTYQVVAALTGSPTPATSAEPVPPSPPGQADEPDDDAVAAVFAAGIRPIDARTFEIDRGGLDQLLARPAAMMRGARVVPATKDGKIDGTRLFAIRRGSPLAQLGLKNGDTLRAINGHPLLSPAQMLEAYAVVREAKAITLELSRGGKPLTLRYTIK